MIAAYPDIQASNYMIYEDLLLPGIYDPGMVLLLKGKINNNDPVGYGGLMFAIVRQAKIDAARGSKEAIEWLKSDQCFDYCFAVGFEHKNVLDWLKRGKYTK
jgi:hypothetical protein